MSLSFRSHYADLQTRIRKLIGHDAARGRLLSEKESQESENPREHFNVDAKNVKEWAFVRPSIQCASLGFRTDETLTLALFACLDDLDSRAPSVSDSVYGKAWLSTGYLNLHDSFSSHLLSARDTPVHLLAAAPSANGFFTARGIAGSLPMAYSLMEKRLYREAVRRGVYREDKFVISVRTGRMDIPRERSLVSRRRS